MEDQLHENLSHMTLPTTKELLREATEIEETLKEVETHSSPSVKPKGKQTQTDSELQQMISEASDLKPYKSSPRKHIKQGQKTRLILEDRSASASRNSNDEDYQESFTSQQETAEIREHMDSLDARLENMEKMIEGIMVERQNLPRHLELYRSEMNKQMTIISEKLHTALEKNINPEALAQVNKDVEVMGGESDHVLNQLKTDLTAPPTVSSPTSRREPITKQKRRVRVVE